MTRYAVRLKYSVGLFIFFSFNHRTARLIAASVSAALTAACKHNAAQHTHNYNVTEPFHDFASYTLFECCSVLKIPLFYRMSNFVKTCHVTLSCLSCIIPKNEKNIFEYEAASPEGGSVMNKMKLFSAKRREALMKQLEAAELDVLIIGGGITGAGVAWDAASRGLSTG